MDLFLTIFTILFIIMLLYSFFFLIDFNKTTHLKLFITKEIEKITINGIIFQIITDHLTKNLFIIVEPDNFDQTMNVDAIKTYDHEFDLHVKLFTDDERNAAARLSKQIRKKLQRFSKEIIFTNGAMKIKLKEEFNKNHYDVMVELSKLYDKIFRSVKIEYLLINNIRNESIQKVRENNLEMLLKSKAVAKFEDFINGLKKDTNVNIALTACSYSKNKSKMIDIMQKNNRKKAKYQIRAIECICSYLKDSEMRNILIESMQFIDREKLGYFFKELFKLDHKEWIADFLNSLKMIHNIETADMILLIDFFLKNEVKESIEWIEMMKKKYPERIGDIAQNALHILLRDQRGDMAIMDKVESGDLSISESDGKLSEIEE
jgi:hypothetical protein